MATTTTEPAMDTQAAVRLLYATIQQWRDALDLGLDLRDPADLALLRDDLDRLKQATDVLADQL